MIDNEYVISLDDTIYRKHDLHVPVSIFGTDGRMQGKRKVDEAV